MKDRTGKKFKIDETWIMVALCFLMVCIVLGFCSSSKSLYIAPVTEALGISRSVFSVNDSVRFITTAVVNLFFGALIAKFGPKKLICAGFICLITCMMLYSCASSVLLFYVGSVFLGVGLSWTTTTMVGYVVHRWCKENTGTIMGAVLASNGIGAAIATQVVSPVIYQEGNPFGFRNAYRLAAVLLAVVLALVLLFFRNEPKQQSAAVPAAKKKRRGRSWPGVEWHALIRRPYFYASLVFIFLTGAVLQGITGIAAPLMKDVGLDPAFVANALSIHAISLSCFKFLSGFLYDRCGLRITVNICMVTASVVILLLSVVTASPVGMVLAILYCVFSALALPLETVMLPIYAADLFGERSYDMALGIFVSVNTAGYAVGAPISNLCYDLTGSYHIALYAGAALMFVVLIGMQFVISAANREHKKAEIPG